MSIFLTLLQLFPAILQGVASIEAAFPHAPGPVKKQLLLNSVGTAARVAGKPVAPPLLAAVSGLIDTTVASLNGAGLLGKPAPTPVPGK